MAQIGAPKFWEQHCPDCTHCFTAHNEDGCQAQKLSADKSTSGVLRRTKCNCENASSSLVNWEQEKLKEAGIVQTRVYHPTGRGF